MNKGGYGMKTLIVLLVLIVSICTAAYGQVEETSSQSSAFHFDQDQLLDRLATLKPFTPDKGEPEPGYAFFVQQEEFRNSLIFLAKEKVDEVMEDFVNAVAFSFKDDTQFLMLTQWKDQESARKFMRVENELWRLKDEKYQHYIQEVVYEEIDIAKDEKALLTRKTLKQSEQKQNVTIFVSARKNYLFECTLIGKYQDSEVKKLILQIWKIIKSEEKRGAR
jgi:rRNA-processing protein FCF1